MPKTRCASCQDEHPPYNTLIQLFTPERIATPSLHRGIFHFVLRRLHYELFGHNYYLHNFSLVSFRSTETVRVPKPNKLKPFGNLLYTLNCVGLISLEHSLRDAHDRHISYMHLTVKHDTMGVWRQRMGQVGLLQQLIGERDDVCTAKWCAKGVILCTRVICTQSALRLQQTPFCVRLSLCTTWTSTNNPLWLVYI